MRINAVSTRWQLNRVVGGVLFVLYWSANRGQLVAGIFQIVLFFLLTDVNNSSLLRKYLLPHSSHLSRTLAHTLTHAHTHTHTQALVLGVYSISLP